MKTVKDDTLEIIKRSLWNKGGPSADEADYEAVYKEMKIHGIEALAGSVLCDLELPRELAVKWKSDVLYQVNSYYIFENLQRNLPIDVPYVILKGTSASQYYPVPEYRAMGDIDIMTRHEDCEKACRMLLEQGFTEVTTESDEERARHREFSKDGISVEVHYFFASMNDPVKTEIFDNLVIDHITKTHVLPDLINGMVLLEHMNQHLEEGLGLRQIIDWMMFIDRCLPDEKWPEFRRMAQKTGLERLAVVSARMCEMYLGLDEHDWAQDADPAMCATLMDYVVSCGNFGIKRSEDDMAAVGRASRLRDPLALIRDFQKEGRKNWKLARYPVFVPFAFIWQAVQSVKKNKGFVKEYKNSRRIDTMLDDLGVKRSQNGLVRYENGTYVKEEPTAQ